MNRLKNNRQKTNEYDKPTLSIEKVADANIVIGQSIITVSGTQVIPLTSNCLICAYSQLKFSTSFR